MVLKAAIATMAMAVSLPAWAAGNAEAGRQIVEHSCTSCHAGAESSAAADAAPPFAEIARHNKANRTWVRTWLTGPHPPMQGIDLSRRQIDDVVAYLNSLPTD